uniref:Ubiquitin carboxyl-terminal hydrolase 47 n=1 Tax=Syphacia muris TaxID=451379 RepID=A0A0N5ASV0_9BILA
MARKEDHNTLSTSSFKNLIPQPSAASPLPGTSTSEVPEDGDQVACPPLMESSLSYDTRNISTGEDNGNQLEIITNDNSNSPTDGSPTSIPALAFPTSSVPITSPSLGHLDDNGHCYVGLVNQAMTCYLNSLIQTLYMTPEFRNAIYEWKFSGAQSEEARSIPCQLQKLFLLLQTSNRESLETRELTRSFGWGAGEAYDQHDVQELCRIMFDALEQKWRKTNNSSLIQNLYRYLKLCYYHFYLKNNIRKFRGSMEDFVKCLACSTESVKNDVFLDLPLAIKQFGVLEAYKSVEEALQAFIKPEILDGNNQYFCEKCGKKQDAQKGLRITEFPYLLTIQLKRFDFDYNTLHRIKLNDRMVFPFLLNLNGFVYDSSKDSDCEAKRKKISWASVAAGTKKVTEPAVVPPVDYGRFSLKAGFFPKFFFTGIRIGRAENQHPHIEIKEVEELLKKDGPYVYELFSVMVHQGSATGGHYYAYIKNMDQDAWFCFNDSSVTVATVDDIHRTYGGSFGGWACNTNAYMLMYRRIDKAKNAKFLKTCDLPDHLKTILKRWETTEEEKRLKKEYEESLVKVGDTIIMVHVLINGISLNAFCGMERSIRIPYTSKLKDIFDQTIEITFVDSELTSANRFRLIECSDSTFSMKRAFSSLELENVSLNDLYPKYARTLKTYRQDAFFILDCVPINSDFFEVMSSKEACTCKLYPVDIAKKTILTSIFIQFSLSCTVFEMRKKIGEYFGFNKELYQKTRVVIDKKSALTLPSFLLLENDDESCSTLINTAGTRLLSIYFDTSISSDLVEEDRRKNFEKSRLLALLERKRLAMTLTIHLPAENDYKQAGIAPLDFSNIDSIILNCASSNDVECSTTVDSSNDGHGLEHSMKGDCKNEVTQIHREHHSPAPATEVASLPVASASSATMSNNYPLSASLTNSQLSSTSSLVSEDDREPILMEFDHSGTSSPFFTPIVSPSVSDSDDACLEGSNTLNTMKERYERIFNAVADMKDMTEVEGLSPVDLDLISSTAESSEDTVTMGAQTVNSAVGSETSGSNYEVVVLSRSSENGVNEIVVELDGRQSVSSLKEWLSKLLAVDVNRFVVLKHYKKGDDGYENIFYDNETVRDYYSSVVYISINLRSPLKENERVIRVSQFVLDTAEYERWPYLFSIVVSPDTKVHDMLLKCRDLLKATCNLDYELRRLRLRELDVAIGAPVMNSGDTMGRRGGEWSRSVYLQILSEKEADEWEECGTTSYPVAVQRWNPSTLEVSPRSELVVAADLEDQTAALKGAIASHFHVPVEKIELSEPYPSNVWTKYPYTKDRLELLDTVYFSSRTINVNNFNGKLVYFKLNDELPKRLTEAERRAIRIKDSSAKSMDVTKRRKEKPLRIQLSSSVSEDNTFSLP